MNYCGTFHMGVCTTRQHFFKISQLFWSEMVQTEKSNLTISITCGKLRYSYQNSSHGFCHWVWNRLKTVYNIYSLHLKQMVYSSDDTNLFTRRRIWVQLLHLTSNFSFCKRRLLEKIDVYSLYREDHFGDGRLLCVI